MAAKALEPFKRVAARAATRRTANTSVAELVVALAFGVVGFAFSFGANLPGYETLHTYIPLFQGIRAAARWGTLFLIAIAILAGFTMASLEAKYRTRSWWAAFAIGVIGLVTVEALRAPLNLVRFNGVAPVHRLLAQDTVTGIVVFPLYGGVQFSIEDPSGVSLVFVQWQKEPAS